MYPYDPFQVNPFLSQLQQPQTTSIKYVNGRSGVESHQMPPNSSDIFLDSNDKKFYTKHTDATGAATIKCFDYTESEADKPVEYVTKAEFELFKEKMKGAKHEPSGNTRKQQNSNAGGGSNDARGRSENIS